jgi:hypothetical protein
VVRHLVAFAFPERPALAESLLGEKGHSLFPVLSASVRDPSRLPYVALEYFFTEFERTAVSLLAAAGPKAVPALCAVLPRTRETPKQRFLYNLLAQVDTDAAVDALLAAASKPAAQQGVARDGGQLPGQGRRASRRAGVIRTAEVGMAASTLDALNPTEYDFCERERGTGGCPPRGRRCPPSSHTTRWTLSSFLRSRST